MFHEAPWLETSAIEDSITIFRWSVCSLSFISTPFRLKHVITGMNRQRYVSILKFSTEKAAKFMCPPVALVARCPHFFEPPPFLTQPFCYQCLPRNARTVLFWFWSAAGAELRSPTILPHPRPAHAALWQVGVAGGLGVCLCYSSCCRRL